MSRIVTFYSYKGGVGRTFALANIGVLLAKRGKRVLLMDWDLEAPGLDRYFRQFLAKEWVPKEGVIHLLGSAAKEANTEWQRFLTEVKIPDCAPLHLVASGDRSPDYVERVREFSWTDFFEHKRGGEILDRWRSEWKETYDTVFVDSRTGITDTGGVCTVFLPDILVLVFSANEQSLKRGIQVANGVQVARRELAVRRAPAAILPLPGRFDGRDEVDEADKWLDRFARDLKPFYDDWLPKHLEPRQMLEVTKIPYVTKFSFGEPLAVISHSVTDPELPGHHLDNVARLLASDFAEAEHLLSGGGRDEIIAEFRAELARVPIDELAIANALESIESSPGTDDQLSELFREAGVVLLRQSLLVPAENYLRRAVALSEDSLGTQHSITATNVFYLAELLRVAQRLSEAESLYLRALRAGEMSLGPQDIFVANVYMRLATLYRGSKRVEEAIDMYQRALEIFKETGREAEVANAYTNLGILYQQSRRRDEAEEMYRRVLEISEKTGRKADVANAYTNLATLYQEGRRFDEAVAVLKRGLEIDDKQLHLRIELARIYQRQGNLDEAEAVLLQSLEIDDKQLHPRAELAKIYQRGNKLERAEAALLSLLELDVRNLQARTELAKIYQRQGKLNQAEGVLMTLLELDTKNLQARTELSKIYQRQGKLDQAETTLLQSLEIDNKQLHPRLDLAKIYQRQGRLDQAEAVLLQTLEIDHKQLAPRNELAKIYLDRGKIELAETVLLQSLEIDPKQVPPRIELAKIYQRQDRLDRAEDVLLQSLRMDGKQLQARTELARIYQRQGKLDQAGEYAEDVLSLDPLNNYAMSELIAIWTLQGQKAKCAQRFLAFIAQPEYRFSRYSQPAVFRFFQCCKKFGMEDKAKLVFDRFQSELDDRNREYFESNLKNLRA